LVVKTKESLLYFVIKIGARSFVWYFVGKAISSGTCSALLMGDGLCNFVASLSNDEIRAWSLLWRKNFIFLFYFKIGIFPRHL